MSETTQNFTAQTEQQEESHKAPTRYERLSTAFPRVTKALTITGAVALGAAGTALVKNVRSNKDHLSSAADHAGEALSEVAASVSPDTEV